MGYFSNYALDYEADYEDNSYPSPEKQLMWRLKDLQSRWEELKEYSAPHPKYDASVERRRCSICHSKVFHKRQRC